MAKVILSLEGSVIREMNLDKERVTIGRKPQNDIQIENLAVSSEHARIVTILNDSFLEDMGSTNGTLVNGNPIKKHILQNNDVIEIGKYTLKFVSDTPVASHTTPEDFERTMVLRAPVAGQRAPATPAPGPEPKSETVPKMTAAPKPAPAMAPAAPAPTQKPAAAAAPAPTPKPVPAMAPAAPTPAPKPASAAAPVSAPTPPASPAPVAAASGQQAFIQIMSGPGVGKELPLTKNLTTLGKPGVQVAVITKRPQGYFITHVEGANFPVLNSRKLDTQAHLLGDHDLIEIAGVKMEFFFKQS